MLVGTDANEAAKSDQAIQNLPQTEPPTWRCGGGVPSRSTEELLRVVAVGQGPALAYAATLQPCLGLNQGR